MNRDTFQRLVISSTFNRRKMYESFLMSIPLLCKTLNDYQRAQVAECLWSKTYSAGEQIFKQNDKANGIYFIESGWVRIVKEDPKTGHRKELCFLSRGEYFGELALVNKAPRSASAYALGDQCKLAFMEIDSFERLMGPCIYSLKVRINSYKH